MTEIEDRVLARYRKVVADVGSTENHILKKSSLYQRLLNGKRPLVIPPPLNHSYPWYRVVESEIPVSLPFGPTDWAPDWDTRHGIAINQDVWSLISGDIAQDITVTFPGWDTLGFVWRVWLVDEPAEKTEAFLCCRHREDVRSLTTVELLEAESRWHVERVACWVAQSASLEDDEFKAAYLASGIAGKAAGVFGEILADQHLQHCRTLASDRLAAGLSLEYSQAEIDHKVAEYAKSLLGDSWFAKDGKLFHRTWQIQRVSPQSLGPEHYLEPA